ncbi:MobC family plasmid mobilization relaxosome protein [Streptomyces sp. Isolate_45]|uniref:MobC family plasmid mobilization relaxosome protein n=1 Tax=Streptomyces sp. Isolate_45 TaxID=2950111 RepID=UPI0024820199|nr:MobC family plasmid mobilization relaxosome protein [Streptomyces sp. Isolate_45]MDA5279877.1 MobC family plasmid mobilization relaxosome protein [Streptomyces sp. Isolate_45]
MAEPASADERRKTTVSRRGREDSGPRGTRIKISYNEDELTVVREAARRECQAVAAYVGEAALAVAAEKVAPVAASTKDVVSELIQARQQVARIGNNLNQIAKALNADGEVTAAQLAAVLRAVEPAVRRLDEATLVLMRERRPRG